MKQTKQYLKKFYTAAITAVVLALFILLRFIVIEENKEFYKDQNFWIDFIVITVLITIIRDTYWRNGSQRGSKDMKYIGSGIEYSLRVDRLKTHKPCLTEDFYTYIDEKNVELYINARNDFLDDNAILKSDYYSGSPVLKRTDDGLSHIEYSTPHCMLSLDELAALQKTVAADEVPYYTKRQCKAIQRAVSGKFHYEVLNATEILSGIKMKRNKYATSYNPRKNKATFMLSKIVITFVFAVLGAFLGARIAQEGWNIGVLYDFLYASVLIIWHAINADDAGFSDIADTKRGVNINRANIITMYATSRNMDNLFNSLDIEITKAVNDYVDSLPIKKTKKEKNNGVYITTSANESIQRTESNQ